MKSSVALAAFAAALAALPAASWVSILYCSSVAQAESASAISAIASETFLSMDAPPERLLGDAGLTIAPPIPKYAPALMTPGDSATVEPCQREERRHARQPIASNA